MDLQKDFMNNDVPKHTPLIQGNQKYLERKRINSLLEKAAQKPVIVMVAGAGYGKSCAIHSFARAANARLAWMQISERDNLEEHLWENFVSVISTIDKKCAEKLENTDFPGNKQQLERFLIAAKPGIIPGEKYLIVFDDLHLIKEPAILHFIEQCIYLYSSFSNITCVLISRTESALNLEKLTAKKLVKRITEDELKFSQEEMISYFRLNNLAPAPGIASLIYKDTEGWAFAIHLASLSLRNNPNPAYVPKAFKQNVYRLIESEIMKSISPDFRKFLLKLSLIENYHPNLLKIIARDTSLDESWIKQMDDLCSFIRFESCYNSYHIHHLLLDYLRERQKELSREEMKEVWARTALWCMVNNRKIDAIICNEKAGDYNSIVRILDTFPLILSRPTAEFILGVLNRAPEGIYNDYPGAIVMRNRTLASLDKFDQSWQETLDAMPRLKALPESPQKHYALFVCNINLGTIKIIQSIYTRDYNFVHYFKIAAEEAVKSSHVTKAPLNGLILSSYACRVMAPASRSDIEDYIKMLGKIIPYTVLAMGGYRYGLYELSRGELAFFRGELKDAEKLLSLSVTKAGKRQQYETRNRALFYLLRIHLSRGDFSETEKILKEIEADLDEVYFPNRYFYHDIITGWYHIQTGRREEIALWLKSDYEESELHSGAHGLEKLVKAKYFFSGKRYPAALAAMEDREKAEPLIMGDIEMKVLEAVSRYGQSDKAGAFRALEEAYRLAKPAALFMPFTELGKDMRALTEAAIREKALGKLVNTLSLEWLEETKRRAVIYAKKIYPQKRRAARGEGPNASALSRREMTVLLSLSQGLTRQEIAESLSISPKTVKSASRSIYNKLGAYNQADAVRIAVDRGIL